MQTDSPTPAPHWYDCAPEQSQLTIFRLYQMAAEQGMADIAQEANQRQKTEANSLQAGASVTSQEEFNTDEISTEKLSPKV